MTVRQLLELANAKIQEARDIKDKCDSEGRGMTTEEANKFDDLMNESERLQKEAVRELK